MLIAILTFLFLGGGATSAMLDYVDEARGNARAVIGHDDRRKSALDTLKAVEKLTKGLAKEQKKSAKALVRAWKEHDGDYDTVEALWQAHYDALDVYFGELLDRREELKNSVTREEWSEIFPAP